MVKTSYRFLTVFLPAALILGFWFIPFILPDTNVQTIAFLAAAAVSVYFILLIHSSPLLSWDGQQLKANYFYRTEKKTLAEVTEIQPNSAEGRWLTRMPSDLVCLRFTDGSRWLLQRNLYRGMDDLISVLFEKAPSVFPPRPDSSPATLSAISGLYSGNLYTSGRFLATVSILAYVLIYAPATRGTGHGWLPLTVGLSAMMLIGFGRMMYYFEILDEQLIIRNYYFPWYYKSMLLESIFEVNLVDRYRLPTMLKLTLKDFTVNRFMGATLRVADWEALQRDLRRAGVKS